MLYRLPYMTDDPDQKSLPIPYDAAYLEGFTRVPHKIIRQGLMRVNFSARENRIFWSIVSFSWSWNKPYCYLTYRQLAQITALSVRHTHETVKLLIDKNILRVSTAKPKSKFTINQDVTTWVVDFKKNEIETAMVDSVFFKN